MIISWTGETTKMLTGRTQPQAMITDLTAMRNYIITDPSDLMWVDTMRKQIADEQNRNRN